MTRKIDESIYAALADYQLAVAPLVASKIDNIAWLSIRQLIDMSSGQTAIIGYRVEVIEMKNKFIDAYLSGLEVNPEEVADVYRVFDVDDAIQLENTVSEYLPNLEDLIDYRYSNQRYPS